MQAFYVRHKFVFWQTGVKSFTRIVLVFIVLFGTLGSLDVSAQKLTFQSATAPAPFEYSPFTATSGKGTLVASLSRYKNVPINYYFTCLTSLASRYVSLNSVNIPYHVYKTGVSPAAEILPWSSTLTYDNVLFGTFTGNGSQSQYFDIVPELGRWAQAGTYSGTLTFELDQGLPGTDNLKGSKTISVSMIYPIIADISILKADSTFDTASTAQELDFGELRPDLEKSLYVVVRANKNWSLSLSVPSRGNMQQPGVDTTIPYSIYFNTSLINISSGTAILISNAPWTSTGQVSYPLKVVIGKFDFVEPGIYKDSFSLTVIAN